MFSTALRSLGGAGGARIVAAAAGGLAVYAGFAPSTLWWMPIIGLALLAIVVAGRTAPAAAGLGFVFGAAMFLPMLSWTGVYVGSTPWIALALAEAALVAPATAIMGAISTRLPAWPLWAACAWVGGETLRAVFPFGGFPWGGLAFTQPDGPLLPLAALVGESGLTFCVALLGFAVGELARRAWRRRSRAALVGLLVAAIAPFALAGLARPAVQTGADAPKAPVAVIQGNVPEPGLEFNARRRAVLDMHAAETTRLARAVEAGTVPRPRFVVWPENSSDIDPYTNTDAAAVITRAAREVGVPMLVGAVTSAGRPGYVYNKGIVWDPVTGPGETYTKRHPVPFAEYIPWRGFFRIFSDKVDLVRADFLPGSRPGNLTIAGIPVGDVICFEIVEDPLVADVVAGGAKVLVVQTNNATFGYTAETYQQQAMSRVRAVQYGREVLIAATSGVSAVIRPDGSVERTIPLFTPGFTVPEVPLIDATTPGTVLGAPIRWVLTVLSPLGLAGALAISHLRRRSGHHRRAEKGRP